MELSKRYQPSRVEDEMYRLWEDGGYFHATVDPHGKKPFSIVIPPPNVTGKLHMGHALNNTLQDILIRYKRMDGYAACWFPGTDHAGIATQNVVEKELAKEGLSRHDLGRERFVARVWEWKEKYGSTIINQLKALGASCDWDRLRFTLDDGLSRAVRQAFVDLFDAGLIYRGDYLINWCPRCGTALSDIEVEHKEVDGYLYYVRYPLKDGGAVTIATTRPETMLGDTAVAVNPADSRYKDLIGKTALLPIIGRSLPIVGAEEVDPEFGTGVLKITPAHDPVDFKIGKRFSLPGVNILNADGTINDNGGPFAGMTREEARQAVVDRLKADGYLEKVEPYRHAVGHCQRCGTAVEPIISTQWFVRMKPLAEPALAAVKAGKIRFYPERWTKLYYEWLENIRDWCISRQLWWGHRIPVWYGPDETPFAAENEAAARIRAREHYGKDVELHQEEDVLDTWFSSSLWPFSVMGWPDQTPELEYFYPTSTLVTGFDILFFWVARMIMMGLRFTGDVPFHDVYLTPLIVDENGQKMSKSRGNSIDPLAVKKTHGMDALRFTLAQASSKGRSMRLSQAQLDEARNFLNKVWNMARFIGMTLGDEGPALPEKITELEDRYILSRLSATTAVVRDNLDSYNFNLASEALYAFVWHDFCDWYLEMAKVRVDTGDKTVVGVLYHGLHEILKLLHPFVPFVTEKIWQTLGASTTPLIVAPYPVPGSRDPAAEAEMAVFRELVGAVRMIRAELNVPQNARVEVVVRSADSIVTELIATKQAALNALAGAREWRVNPALTPPPGSARHVLATAELFIPLADLIDVAAEKARLARELKRAKADLVRAERNLDNPAFRARAPQDVIDKETRKRDEFRARVARIEANLASLGG